MLVRLGHPDAAQAALEGIRARGDWFAPALLKYDPDLEELRKRPEFQALVRDFEARLEQERARARPELLRMQPWPRTRLPRCC
ncbi:hypothetical protein HNR42_002242 [Deinobacterium chartae]|uniref:Uncharacterized protein n=1 Tax=Deinobacterium chartae TaxID=521158 RepID=A0A841HZI3_9DEIO|nr:hypothetical protein [Deinobacterium chartae]MBB6098807.1 hypothetical protein [Deinobacterium chartae]